jgi:hypothetical protein
MKPRSILLAGALLAAAPAHAATYIITYEGTVYDSEDRTGVFGGSGNSLDGMDFTAVYTLTPSPEAVTGGDGATYAYIRGGSVQSAPSVVSAKLTINNITKEVSGDYISEAWAYNAYGGSFDEILYASQDRWNVSNQININSISTLIGSYSDNFISSTDYAQHLNYNPPVVTNWGGGFLFKSYTSTSDGPAFDIYAAGNFLPTSVTIAPLAAAVPEPATWALTILGFGLVGGVMRRQRRKARLGYG